MIGHKISAGGLFFWSILNVSAVVVPNWEIFETINSVDVSQCIDAVNSIPVNRYWDTEKAEFRSGFLGDELAKSYPEHVSNVSKSRYINNQLKTEQITVVETSALFSYMICAIQYVTEMSVNIQRELNKFTEEKKDFALKIIRIAAQTGVEWRTAAEIRAARQLVQKRIEVVERALEQERDMKQLKLDNLMIKVQKRRSIRDIHDINLQRLRLKHEEILRSLQRQRQNETVFYFKDLHVSKYSHREKELDEEFQYETERLQMDIDMAIEAIKFRGQEEIRIEREMENMTSALLLLKGELRVKSVQTIVDTFFIEFESKFKFIFANPSYVAMGSAAIALILFFSVLASEIFLMCKTALIKFVRRGGAISKIGIISDSSLEHSKMENNSRVQLLNQLRDNPIESSGYIMREYISARFISSIETADHLCDVIKTFHCQSDEKDRKTHSNIGLQLPNILIQSNPGNGKSTCARLIAQSSNLEYSILSGNDILAHGPNGDKILRNVLEACSDYARKKTKRFMLIIDDIDSIATEANLFKSVNKNASPRKLKYQSNSSDSQSSVKSCLHLILNAFKNNSPYLCLLLTSTKPVEYLNLALLDRVDRIVILENPTIEQRLLCVINYSKLLLVQYVSAEIAVQFTELERNLEKYSKNDACVCLSPPFTSEKVTSTKKKKVVSKNDTFIYKTNQKDASYEQSSEFDAFFCLPRLASVSRNWTFRDIVKTIQNIQCEVLATEKCTLTTLIWVKETELAIEKWSEIVH